MNTLLTLAGRIPIVNIIDVLCDEPSGQVSLELRDNIWVPYVRGTAQTGFTTKWIKEHYETGDEARNRAEYFVIHIKKYYELQTNSSCRMVKVSGNVNRVYSKSVPRLNKPK